VKKVPRLVRAVLEVRAFVWESERASKVGDVTAKVADRRKERATRSQGRTTGR